MSPYDQVVAVLAATTPDGWWTPDEASDPQGVYGPDGDEVARVNGNLALGGEAADNARFIALARNTYPELLAVARAAAEQGCICMEITAVGSPHRRGCLVPVAADLEAKIREVMP